MLAEQRFASVFERGAVGMTMAAPDGRYFNANPAFCAFVGHPLDSVVGRHFTEFAPATDGEQERALRNGLLEGAARAPAFERRFLHAGGGEVWGLCNVSLVRSPDGRPLHFLTQIQDVTERRRAQEELERSNAELTQFASVASHDLSEPLRVIEGFVDLLARRYTGKLDDDADVFLGHISSASVRMRALIDALLRYARAGNAPLELAQVRSGGLAAQAAEALGARVREAGAQIVVADGLPSVTADETLLRQVFQNLLANAVKHAGRAGVRVAVTAERDGDTWRFSVRDNGPGIVPEDQERIFEMFARGRRVSRGAPGSPGTADDAELGAGIGLSVCQRVVERHGGRIWVDSAPGEGADFLFTLPADDGGPEPA